MTLFSKPKFKVTKKWVQRRAAPLHPFFRTILKTKTWTLQTPCFQARGILKGMHINPSYLPTGAQWVGMPPQGNGLSMARRMQMRENGFPRDRHANSTRKNG
jgi:hypothetical protein